MTKKKLKREGIIPIDKLAKLRECMEKGINYLDLLKAPRYDYLAQCWIVETEGGKQHRFDRDDEAEAIAFYDRGPK